MSTLDHMIASTTSRVIQPNNSRRPNDGDASDLDDEELFAQLEAEIENDDDARVREQGIQRIKLE